MRSQSHLESGECGCCTWRFGAWVKHGETAEAHGENHGDNDNLGISMVMGVQSWMVFVGENQSIKGG